MGLSVFSADYTEFIFYNALKYFLFLQILYLVMCEMISILEKTKIFREKWPITFLHEMSELYTHTHTFKQHLIRNKTIFLYSQIPYFI